MLLMILDLRSKSTVLSSAFRLCCLHFKTHARSPDGEKKRDGEDILDVVSSASPLPDIGQTREHENLFLHNYFNPPPAKSGFPFFTPNSQEDDLVEVDEVEGEEGHVTPVGGVDNDSEVESIICLGEVSSSRDTEIHNTTDVNQDLEQVKVEQFVISR